MNRINIGCKVIFSSLLLVFISYIIILITVVNLDPNPISLNYNISYKTKIKSLFPQGWAFFTKNIKDDEGVYMYKVTETNEYNLVDLNSFTFKDIFGFNRKNRVIGHKFTLVLNDLSDEKWFTYKGDINKIPIDSLQVINVKIKKPFLKGKFIVKRALQLPYQWYVSKHKTYRTSKYVIIKVK